jgi:6-phosphogluconate dehydrogenase (decarboxylating)
MGTGFIQRARANGLTVRAWNRSAAKAQALAANDGGVTACATVAQAVQGAERIHLSLFDDASVDVVLEPLAGALDKGTWIVDHTTTAAHPTAERMARWDARGEGQLDVAQSSPAHHLAIEFCQAEPAGTDFRGGIDPAPAAFVLQRPPNRRYVVHGRVDCHLHSAPIA